MSHDPHHARPRYDPAQILFDGCYECQLRSERRDHGISSLDPQRFALAWKRAADWQQGRLSGGLSNAEVPLLSALWGVQIQLEPRGFPLGQIPRSALDLLLEATRHD